MDAYLDEIDYWWGGVVQWTMSGDLVKYSGSETPVLTHLNGGLLPAPCHVLGLKHMLYFLGKKT